MERYTILPDLIDMHIHGCAGHDTNEATFEALEAMSRCLVSRGITSFCPTSIAHTAADYDQACAAIEWGARHATHLYNAQSDLTHRSPDVVGAVFDNSRKKGVRAKLICDGFHIHPAALRIAFSRLGEDNSVIISDSMSVAGHVDGEYDLGG